MYDYEKKYLECKPLKQNTKQQNKTITTSGYSTEKTFLTCNFTWKVKLFNSKVKTVFSTDAIIHSISWILQMLQNNIGVYAPNSNDSKIIPENIGNASSENEHQLSVINISKAKYKNVTSVLK